MLSLNVAAPTGRIICIKIAISLHDVVAAPILLRISVLLPQACHVQKGIEVHDGFHIEKIFLREKQLGQKCSFLLHDFYLLGILSFRLFHEEHKANFLDCAQR